MIQTRDEMNLTAGRGVAVCEFKLTNGFADYLLFVDCYRPSDRHSREETWSEENADGRWRCYYDELPARDKLSLDIFWLRDESLEDSANLPDPHILAEEIADDLRSALEQVEEVLGDLQERAEVVSGEID